jgi:hypothetical protein
MSSYYKPIVPWLMFPGKLVAYVAALLHAAQAR